MDYGVFIEVVGVKWDGRPSSGVTSTLDTRIVWKNGRKRVDIAAARPRVYSYQRIAK